MITEEQKRKIVEFAKERYKSNDRYHRMKHIRTVVSRALWLARIENADEDVCWASAMLHDIAKAKEGDHGNLGAEEAKAMLLGMGIDGNIADKVYDAIYFHNKRFYGGPIERQILWDADKWGTLTLDGFKNRVVKYLAMKASSKKELAENVEKEYLIFKGHFHTKEGKRNDEENRAAVEAHIAQLKHDAAS